MDNLAKQGSYQIISEGSPGHPKHNVLHLWTFCFAYCLIPVFHEVSTELSAL